MRCITSPKVARWARFLPPLDLRRDRPPQQPWVNQPWEARLPPVSAELRTVAGIWRNPEVETSAFSSDPLPLWEQIHYPVLSYARAGAWRALLPATPKLMRAYARLKQDRPWTAASPKSQRTDSKELKALLRTEARQLGLSAIGVARFDPRYTFLPYQEDSLGDRVVVCIQEQSWSALQTAPSARAQRSAYLADAAATEAAIGLAVYLREHGHDARAYPPAGMGVAIHYGVEAGLGQLGLNGQLLTPFAGSRCRIVLINTNAPLELDGPVDYGIHQLCDECRACVRRCPVGAIPATRKSHRGVKKAKIQMDRCLPAVVQAQGCAVCTKVCPVQRYGLATVLKERESSGRILGKETDELEGYDWPVDGSRHGPDSKPRHAVSVRFLKPPGLRLEPQDVKFRELNQRKLGSLDMG